MDNHVTCVKTNNLLLKPTRSVATILKAHGPVNLTVKEQRLVFARRARQKAHYVQKKKEKMKEKERMNMVHLNAGLGLCRRNRGRFVLKCIHVHFGGLGVFLLILIFVIEYMREYICA